MRARPSNNGKQMNTLSAHPSQYPPSWRLWRAENDSENEGESKEKQGTEKGRKGMGKTGLGQATAKGPRGENGAGQAGEKWGRVQQKKDWHVSGKAAGPPAKSGSRNKGAENLARTTTGNEAPHQPGSGDSEESAWPELVPPFEPPQDSRVVLSGRSSALEQSVQGLAGKEEGPRYNKAQERLQRVKEEIRAAGGRTRKRVISWNGRR